MHTAHALHTLAALWAQADEEAAVGRLLYLALRSPQRELRSWAVLALCELARRPLARPVLLQAGGLEALGVAQATLAPPPPRSLAPPRPFRRGGGAKALWAVKGTLKLATTAVPAAAAARPPEELRPGSRPGSARAVSPPPPPAPPLPAPGERLQGWDASVAHSPFPLPSGDGVSPSGPSGMLRGLDAPAADALAADAPGASTALDALDAPDAPTAELPTAIKAFHFLGSAHGSHGTSGVCFSLPADAVRELA